MLRAKIWLLLGLEYLAESAAELRFGLLRDVLEQRIAMPAEGLEQICTLLPPGTTTDGIDAISAEDLKAELSEIAAAFAAVHGLMPMLLGTAEVSEQVRRDVERASSLLAIVQRCADYAQRAADSTADEHRPALVRLAEDLGALVRPRRAA